MRHFCVNSTSTLGPIAITSTDEIAETQHFIFNVMEKTNTQLIERVRESRKAALQTVTRFSVVVSDDGKMCRTIQFDQPPTLGQIVEAAGPDAFVVSYGQSLMPRQEVAARSLAAQ